MNVTRTSKHHAFRALLCSLTLVACASAQQQEPAAPAAPKIKVSDRERAEQAYLSGARMLDRQDLAGAQAEFERATKLDPTHRDYGLAFALTREHRIGDLVERAARARMTNHPDQAETLLAEARLIDPTNERVLEHTAATAAAAGTGTVPLQTASTAKTSFRLNPQVLYAAPIEIAPDPARHSLHLRGDARQAIEQAATTFGIHATLDDSVAAEPLPPLRFDLDETTYAEAMPPLLKMAHLFGVAVEPKTLLVARDTQENRARLERQVEETIYVPGSTPEQLNELTNIVKNVFDVKQIVIGQSSGTLVVRAPRPTLSVLNETLKDLIDGAAEVLLEVKLISVDRARTVNTGTQTPTSAGAFSVAGEAQSIVSANQSLVSALISSGGYVPTGNAQTDTIYEALYLVLSGAVQDAKVSGLIATAGHGLSLTGIYLGSGATVNLSLNSSDTRALDDISVRVADRQTSTLRVGQRYPITTATYSSGVSSATSAALSGVTVNGVSASSLLNQFLGSGANQTIPQIQYEDLGITLKTTPTVLRSGLIDMKIDMKIEALTGLSANNIPVLTSRVFQSDLTVADGTSAVMISELSRTESASISGLPGLADLPGFQQTAADKLRDVASSDLVLLVTPHLIRHRAGLYASRVIPFSTSTPQEF